jgi:hypothetical protein
MTIRVRTGQGELLRGSPRTWELKEVSRFYGVKRLRKLGELVAGCIGTTNATGELKENHRQESEHEIPARHSPLFRGDRVPGRLEIANDKFKYLLGWVV